MKAEDGEYKKYPSDEQQRLLITLLEELKLPLLQVNTLTELNTIKNKVDDGTIQLVTQQALRMLDHYVLSLRLAQEENMLEPVSLSAVLHNSVHNMSRFAKIHNCELRLETSGHYEPVMAHKAGMEAVMESLGASLIQAQANGGQEKPVVTLAIHRSRWGLVAGAYANLPNMNAAAFRRARSLYGQARQPFNHVLASGGAGIFIANALLSTMAAQLHSSRHRKLNGLAATLQPSHQMALI